MRRIASLFWIVQIFLFQGRRDLCSDAQCWGAGSSGGHWLVAALSGQGLKLRGLSCIVWRGITAFCFLS